MDIKPVSFIPGLFKSQNVDDKLDQDEPFISAEALEQYCSLFTADGIPNNVREDPHLAEIIKLSDEDLNDIAQAQSVREKRQKEEETKKKEQERLDEKIKKKSDSKIDEILNENAFFLKKSCPVNIPYKSSLTHDEHEAYLRVFLRLKEKSTVSGAEIPGYRDFLMLQHRVYEEQANFMTFSHQVAKLELATYNTVPDVINKYIDGYVQRRCMRAAKYKEHYITEQHIPICPQDPENNFSKLSFSHIGHLLSLGMLPLIKIPYKLKSYTLTIDESVSQREHLAQMPQDNNVLNDTPVSSDRNAEYLAQQHRANIVISTSALKVLADNHGPNFDKEWDIPVEVKSYLISDPDGGQVQHRVVYIDKPMPKKTWTPLEKKQLFFKKAALVNLTEIVQQKKFRMTPPVVLHHSKVNESYCDESRAVAKYDDNFFNLSETSDNDVFGNESLERTKYPTKSKKRKGTEATNKPPGSSKSSKLNADQLQVPINKIQEGKDISNFSSQGLNLNNVPSKPEVTVNNDGLVTRPVAECSSDQTSKVNAQGHTEQTFESSSTNVLDNLLGMQESLLKPSHTQDKETEKQKEEPSTSSRTPPRPWAHKLSTDWSNSFEFQLCPDWTGKNVHYQLFSLGPDACLSNCPLAQIRILVRSNLHGLAQFKVEKEKCKTYVAFPKVENQPYFGCEVSTMSEVTQQWVQLLVRPNTSLLLLRVCENSGEVLMTEDKNLTEILKDGKQRHIGFSSSQPLATFYAVFSALLGQPSGHYLLHHDPKTEAFIQLMKAADLDKDTNVHIYNLHKAYAAASVTTKVYSVPPWLAIDTHILTSFHKQHKKIPGTFPMKNPTKKFNKGKKRKKQIFKSKKKSLADLDKPDEDELIAF